MSQHQESQIPDSIANEVLEKASELYAQTNTEGYSLTELQEIGEKVEIPPEIMSEALNQVREKHRQLQIIKEKKEQQLKIIKLSGFFLALLITIATIFSYNTLNSQREEVKARWAQVENQLQRKANLIPTLINLTQAQANQEKQLILLLENARQEYLKADNFENKLVSTEKINEAINQFNQYALNNQNLASSQAFINLQYEIAGTENRIATEIMRYNQSVQKYNQSVRSFPFSIIANLTNFQEESFFK
ncbi:LemA family protein [Geminocystis sp. CENA526]|uniref:LemA family protein n=1 Tax=Geminocystis sp. CENA526 TaxID=1355871 RepID=UPI003D6E38F4